MIARISEAKILIKQISCDSKCNFKGEKCNSNKKWNNVKCQREC